MANKPTGLRELTAKQALFVQEYMVDLSATNAAIRAGYSPKSAGTYAHEMLGLPHVQAAVTEAFAARAERTKITADYVLAQAVKIHECCMQEVEPFTDRYGEQIHDKEGRPLFVFNAAGATKALELVGKHIDVRAFSDKLDLTNSDGSLAPKVIDASQLSTEALRELAGVLNGKSAETDGGWA